MIASFRTRHATEGTPMSAPHRSAILLSALMLAAMPLLANAAQVRWPLVWKAGDAWVYETESLDRRIENGQPQAMRTTDRTEIRVDQADANGYVQTWTTRDSRVETVEGDRSSSDMLAPVLDQFDGYGMVVEFGADGRYRRMRNIEETTAKIRTAMQPVTDMSIGKTLDSDETKLAKVEREAIDALMQMQLAELFESFFSRDVVETMTTAHIRTFTGFVGGTFATGKRYRDTEPMRSVQSGKPLPAKREYTLTVDKRDPGLARLRWTHTLDTNGDVDALWLLASELANEKIGDIRGAGRPHDLMLREEGMILFRRDTGVIELLQTDVVSRYGDTHDQQERSRMRLVGASRSWVEDSAATKH
jgi:hypothetical protein